MVDTASNSSEAGRVEPLVLNLNEIRSLDYEPNSCCQGAFKVRGRRSMDMIYQRFESFA